MNQSGDHRFPHRPTWQIGLYSNPSSVPSIFSLDSPITTQREVGNKVMLFKGASSDQNCRGFWGSIVIKTVKASANKLPADLLCYIDADPKVDGR